MKKDITIVIPWSNRPELEKTLRANTEYLKLSNFSYEIVVVNCGGDTPTLSTILSEYDATQVSSIHVDNERFNKSLALNKGINTCKSIHFMCLDADVILQSVDFIAVFAEIKKGHFVTIKEVNELDQVISPIAQLGFEVNGVTSFTYKIELEKNDGEKIEIALNKNDLINNKRSAPGIIIVSTEDMVQIKGYNSELEGWGWEDIDLIARLQFSGKKRIEMGSVLHLSHDNDTRHLDPEASNKSENENFNFQKCLINYQLALFDGTLIKDS